MPNHISHKMIIHKDADEILEFIKSEDYHFDFNKLIPMPPELNITSGGDNKHAFVYSVSKGFTDTTPPSNDLYEFFYKECWVDRNWSIALQDAKAHFLKLNRTEDIERFLNDAKYIVENYKNYGVISWYGWCSEHWKTKWNSYNSEVNGNVLTFQTAWSSPWPVLNKLIQDKKMSCTLFGWDEGGWTYYEKEYEDGELVHDDEKNEDSKSKIHYEIFGRSYYVDEELNPITYTERHNGLSENDKLAAFAILKNIRDGYMFEDDLANKWVDELISQNKISPALAKMLTRSYDAY